MITEDGVAVVDVLVNDAAGLVLVSVDPAVHGTASVVGDQVTYVPDAGWSGTETLTYTVQDGSGTTATAVVVIVVTDVDDPPIVTVGPDIVVAEDAPAQVLSGWAFVSSGAEEPGQPVSVTVIADADLFAVDPALDPVTGDLTFTPAPDANGTASLLIIADDSSSTGAANATITITPVNDAPAAAGDALVVDEGEADDVDVLANDADADGDALTLVAVDVAGVDDGVVGWTPDGVVTYTPTSQSGTDSATYTVQDAAGVAAQAVVTFTVQPVPGDPVAADDAWLSDGTPLVVAAPGVLANDGDEDGDSLSVVAVSSPSIAGGTLAWQPDGSFTFTPAPAFSGDVTWTYTVDDGTGRQATATLSISVSAVVSGSSLYFGPGGSFSAGPLPVAGTEPDDPADPDADPGRTVVHDGKDLLVDLLDHPLRFGVWSTGARLTPLVLDGPASLELWSAIEEFDADKDADISVWVQDCDVLGLLCTTLAHIDDVHVKKWNGGVGTWARSDWSLGDLDHTVAPGRQLRVILAFGHRDVWLAMSGSRPTALHLTTG